MEAKAVCDSIGLNSRATHRAILLRTSRHLFGISRLNDTALYGKIVCIKKTLNLDDKLVQQAKVACGAKTDTETVRLGLEALVRQAAYERLRALRGTEPRAQDVPRRREGRPTKRKAG